MLLSTVNLRILRSSLSQLADSAYTIKALELYTNKLISVIDHVLGAPGHYPDDVLCNFTHAVWLAHKYLSGSTSKEVPYELEYSLRAALTEWVGGKDFIITAAFAYNLDFHFLNADILSRIKKLIDKIDYSDIDALCIHISFPRLYKHKPIYNIPLYHELGHFVDRHLQITSASFFHYPCPAGTKREVESNHRGEYFADLFAACYVGNACSQFLKASYGNQPATDLHPSVADRINVTQAFLTESPHPVVDMFNDVMTRRKVPLLSARFSKPSVEGAFNDIRPHIIVNEAELHGSYLSSWEYLERALKRQDEPWSRMTEEEIDRTINDLLEKAIRNKAIREQWAHGTA